MSETQSWTLAIGLLGLVALPPIAASAADDDGTVTEKVLDILREQGTIDEDRYRELSREAEEERAEAAARSETADDDEWTAYWKDGTRIERRDGSIKLKIGGRLQFDATAVGAEGAVVDFADSDPDDDFDNPEGTGVDFRRARLFVSGTLWDHGIFKAQYDFAGTDADFKDVYVGLQKLPYMGTITFGHQFEPFSLGQQTSSKYITFMSRSLPVLAFSAERNSGVKITHRAFDDRMTWSVGGFRVVGDSGEDFSNQGDYNVGARITGLPVWEDDGRRLVHVGYGYRHEFGDERAFGAKPEVNTVDELALTPTLDVDGVDVFGFEFATVNGPLSFEVELSDALVDRDGMRNLNLWGGSGQVSWFVTGEHRAYDRRIGAFGRTAPKRPFSLAKGDWGAFEVAARYAHLDLNDEDVRGSVLNTWTLGVNWYLYRNLRFMLNGNLIHANGLGEVYVAQARASLDF